MTFCTRSVTAVRRWCSPSATSTSISALRAMLLRAFSRYCAWRQVGDIWVAHPWLIYSELLYQGEPRALEAADQLREEYLQR